MDKLSVTTHAPSCFLHWNIIIIIIIFINNNNNNNTTTQQQHNKPRKVFPPLPTLPTPGSYIHHQRFGRTDPSPDLFGLWIDIRDAFELSWILESVEFVKTNPFIMAENPWGNN